MEKQRISLILSITLLIFLTSLSVFAQNKPSKIGIQTDKKMEMNSSPMEMMNTYLIKFPHTPETCLATLDKISKDSPELLNKIEWGCKAGDHTGYMIVDSKNEISALQMVPASVRSDAKVEKLDKFTMAEIKTLHQNH
jgi:hypothetical protein